MAGWVSPYTYDGYTYNQGNPIVIDGNYYYDITDTTPNGALYNETKYFHGVWVNDDGSLPLNPIGIRNSVGDTNPTTGTIRFDAIVSGGTPVETTIQFDANDGTTNVSSLIIRYNSKDYYSYGALVPTKKGYTFGGYYTKEGIKVYDSNGRCVNGTSYWNNDTWKYMGESLKLYAQWDANTYYVKYNGNGNTDGSMGSSTHTYNESKALTANAFSKTGHSFNGWNTKADGSGTTYANKESVKNLSSTNGATVNLYAQWKINKYDLTVDPSGGTWNGNTSVRTYTQNYHSTKDIPDPQRTGYEFVGWTLTGSGTLENEIYTFGAGDGTLTAKWKRIVLTVTFDSGTNGGTPDSTKNVNYGDTVGTLPTPTKPFYKFIGWFTKAVGGTQISANNVITSNITYYAQFKIDASVKVRYNDEKLPAIVWLKVNGVWKKCVTWIKENGKWNKSSGAD